MFHWREKAKRQNERQKNELVQQYEDWGAYDKCIRAKLLEHAEDAEVIKTNKRPFGITFRLQGWRVMFQITTRQIQWKAIKAA